MVKQCTYFCVDPYPYKSIEDGRSQEDSKFLQYFLHKTEDEIKQASKAYYGNNGGLRSFIFITRSYENLRKVELSDKATSLAVAIIIFAIEGVMSHVKKRKLTKGKKPKIGENELRIIRFFSSCTNKDAKLLLLNSLVFSARASKSIPMGRSTLRHLMYRGMLKTCDTYRYVHSKTDWCSCQESISNIHCDCIGWLSTQKECVINHYLKVLSIHLYKMRCAIVHDGVAPLISHTEVKPDSVATWGMTVSDVYFNNKYLKHYTYNSALSRKKLEEIFISSLWNAFNHGYPKIKT